MGGSQDSKLHELINKTFEEMERPVRVTTVIQNPNMTLPDYTTLGPEGELIGYDLSAGITPKGNVFVIHHKPVVTYNTSLLHVLFQFTNNNETGLKVIAMACQKDSNFDQRFGKLLHDLGENRLANANSLRCFHNGVETYKAYCNFMKEAKVQMDKGS